MGWVSALASASSSSTSAQEGFYKTFCMDQTKIEKSLNERDEDPVTDSGLVASLKFFDDYNHQGGRKPLREFLDLPGSEPWSGFRGWPFQMRLTVNWEIFWSPYSILPNHSTFVSKQLSWRIKLNWSKARFHSMLYKLTLRVSLQHSMIGSPDSQIRTIEPSTSV